LAGFAKQEDLPFFLQELAGHCQYVHLPILAPTKEILKDYRAGGNWQRYVTRFEALMDERRIPETLDYATFASEICCLLCSEATPAQCHRRLVAERLGAHWAEEQITHL
jgi:hypothetical protein